MHNHGTRQDRHRTANRLQQSSYLRFQVWGEKVNCLQFKCKCKQQLLIYLQKHQAIGELSQFCLPLHSNIRISLTPGGFSSTDYLVFHMHRGSDCLVHTGVTYQAESPSHRPSSGFPVPVPPELLAITAAGMKALLKKVLKAHLRELFGIYELSI